MISKLDFVFIIYYQINKTYSDIQNKNKMKLILSLSKLSNKTLPIQLKIPIYFSRIESFSLFWMNQYSKFRPSYFFILTSILIRHIGNLKEYTEFLKLQSYANELHIVI